MKSKYLIIVGIMIAILSVSLVLLNTSFQDLLAQDKTAGRIAYVDIMKVYDMHPEKKAAEEQLSNLAKNMESKLKKEAEKLSKEKQQEMLKSYQKELSEKEQKMIESILQKINKIINEVAQKKKVKLVLEKQNVIYGGYNMTQDVIDYIQTNYKQSSNQAEINTDDSQNQSNKNN